MGLRAVCSSGDSDGQAAFFVAQPSMAGILSKGSPEMGAGDAGDLGGCFFRCTLVFALILPFCYFKRLDYLNDFPF